MGTWSPIKPELIIPLVTPPRAGQSILLISTRDPSSRWCKRIAPRSGLIFKPDNIQCFRNKWREWGEGAGFIGIIIVVIDSVYIATCSFKSPLIYIFGISTYQRSPSHAYLTEAIWPKSSEYGSYAISAQWSSTVRQPELITASGGLVLPRAITTCT